MFLPCCLSVQSKPVPSDPNQTDLSTLDLHLRTRLEKLLIEPLFLPWFHSVVEGVGAMGVGMLRRNRHIKAPREFRKKEKRVGVCGGVYREITAGTKEYCR